jgi:hypothetical protein
MSTGTAKIRTGLRNVLGQDINPATDDKLDAVISAIEDLGSVGGGIPATKATDAYGYQANSVTSTDKYYFYEDGSGNWYILKKVISTGVVTYAKGTGGYSSVYVDNVSAPSGSPSFGTYDATFNNTGASSLSFDAYNYLKTDSIDFPHQQIHFGNHYEIQNWEDVTGAGTSFDIRITTPDTATYSHFVFHFQTEDEFTTTLYEGAAVSGGTAVGIYNSNRNSSNTSGLTITTGPTVTSVGTQIRSWKTGAGTGNQGTSTNGRNEIILKRNTSYLFRFTRAVSGTGYVDYSMSWYEPIA